MRLNESAINKANFFALRAYLDTYMKNIPQLENPKPRLIDKIPALRSYHLFTPVLDTQLDLEFYLKRINPGPPFFLTDQYQVLKFSCNPHQDDFIKVEEMKIKDAFDRERIDRLGIENLISERFNGMRVIK